MTFCSQAKQKHHTEGSTSVSFTTAPWPVPGTVPGTRQDPAAVCGTNGEYWRLLRKVDQVALIAYFLCQPKLDENVQGQKVNHE